MLKEKILQKEELFLSPYAQRSSCSKGRLREETPCPMRTEFQRDRDRIIHSKAFRRLKNKTQVFFSPEGDHYRTRLTHTLDVSQVARSICRNLDLNEDLAEAIALGHDLGHTPFGHIGEKCLNQLCPHGFLHNEQSLRVVDVLEKDGLGLNLTFEVRDGILNHKRNGKPATLEGIAVSLADRIAYLNHDIDDALRAGILTQDLLPKDLMQLLGNSPSERINKMILSIYERSMGKNMVEMQPEIYSAMDKLRDFMFKNVYITEMTKGEETRAMNMLETLYSYFKKNPKKMPEFYYGFLKTYDIDRVVCDYISSMSDKYAVFIFQEIFLPKNFLQTNNKNDGDK